jgi:hypothetical protein
MHIRSSDPNDPSGRFNAGLSVAALLDGLRESPGWSEIAAYHGLADVTAARQEIATSGATPVQPAVPTAAPKDDELLAAAVRWSLDPTTLSTQARQQLRSVVIDPDAKRGSCARAIGSGCCGRRRSTRSGQRAAPATRRSRVNR